MIQKVDDFIKWTKAIFTALISVFSTISLQELNTLNNGKSKLSGILVLIILIIICSRIFEKLLEKLIDNSKYFRKLILGKHFIEGYYVDKVFSNTNELLSTGIIKFEYQKGKFECIGKAFLPLKDGTFRLIGSFNSNSTSYNGVSLKVSYEAHSLISETHDYSGIAIYNFINLGTANEYIGYLYDPYYNGRRQIRARKITGKRLLQINNEHIQHEIIEDFIKETSDFN